MVTTLSDNENFIQISTEFQHFCISWLEKELMDKWIAKFERKLARF